MLVDAHAEAAPGARPGLILFVQTFGDLANFDPHVHVLAADGAFLPDGRFAPLPAVPEPLLVESFRRAVLEFLVRAQALSGEMRDRMLGWGYSGFSVHNQVRVDAQDPEARKKLAGTTLRAPMALEKMTYDAKTGTVIYRSKMHLGLKRNFQVMPGAEWLELLAPAHPRSLRASGAIRRMVLKSRARRAGEEGAERGGVLRGRGRTDDRVRLACQGRLLGTAHPQGLRSRFQLECPKCARGRCASIALIDDPGVVRRILEHLGRWAPEATGRDPPAQVPDWPPTAVIPLTYHAVTEIA